MANPTSIMGANAISWVDVEASEMFQNTDGTTASAIGDRVYYIEDLAGGDPLIWNGGNVGDPILQDGYIQFTDAYLTKALSRTGATHYGVRVNFDASRSDANYFAILNGGSLGGWFNGNRAGLEYLGNFGLVSVANTNVGGGGTRPIVIGEFAHHQITHPSTGVSTHSRNGSEATGDDLGGPVGDTGLLWMGGNGFNFGTQDADAGQCQITRFYVLDTVPDSTQEAALLDWLENGDVGDGGIELTRSAGVVSASTVSASRSVIKSRASGVSSASSFAALRSVSRSRSGAVSSASSVAASATRSIQRSSGAIGSSSVAADRRITRARSSAISSTSSFTASAGSSSQTLRDAAIISASEFAAQSRIVKSRAANVAGSSTVAALRSVTLSRSSQIVAVSAFQALTADDLIGQYVVAGLWQSPSISGMFRVSTSAGVWPDKVVTGAWRRTA